MRLHKFVPTKIERRSVEGTSSPTVYLCGIACPYNEWSQELAGCYFKERFLPGAFRNLGSEDVICCIDHNQSKLLGRRSSGTLKLEDTPEGLRVECSMPNTSYAQDLVALADRGDMRGMSFEFDTIDDEWGTDGGVRSRTVKKADIFEVCFTTDPCYLSTTVEVERRAKILASAPVVGTINLTEARYKISENLFRIASRS